MNSSIFRLLGALSLSLLAACGTSTPKSVTPTVVAGYEGVEDEGFYIQPVDAELLSADRARAEVEYTADDAPGTIVIDTFAQAVSGAGKWPGVAIRHRCGPGRPVFPWQWRDRAQGEMAVLAADREYDPHPA